jgi:steroid delta-isomerase-like uncharacterized protein
MATRKKTILHRWFEQVWNKGSVKAIDKMLTPDFVGHGISDSGKDIHGPEEFKAFFQNFRSAFPDLKIVVEGAVSEGDLVAVRFRATGTHAGEGLGIPPTDQPVEFTGMCMVRVEDERIAEGWNNIDFMQMFQQMGLFEMQTPGGD